MARGKATATAVQDDGEDFDIGVGEVIAPKVDLRKKAKEIKLKPGEKSPVEAAEAAMKRMEGSFAAWIEEEAGKLVQALHAAEDTEFDAAARDELYRCAHDIKGQAATLGFPLAGKVAGTLCLLLDHAGERLPHELVRQHVQAIRAIVAENARDESNPTAVKLAARLDDVTGEYIGSL